MHKTAEEIAWEHEQDLRRRLDGFVQKANDLVPRTDAETDLQALVYRAVSGYFETLECLRLYQGNGHHLAQRVAALVMGEMYPREEATDA